MCDLKQLAYEFKTAVSGSGHVATLYDTVVPLENGDRMLLPAGFIHDGASIPRFVPRWLIDKFGMHNLAAAAHDYLYRYGKYQTEDGGVVSVSRHTADLIFLEIMRRSGVWRWKRNLMYRAVRHWAWKKWGEYRQADAERDVLDDAEGA